MARMMRYPKFGLIQICLSNYQLIEEKARREDMMKLYYKDENVKVLICKITTNYNSMSIDDILKHCDIDMDEFANKQSWDGWDFGALEMEY